MNRIIFTKIILFFNVRLPRSNRMCERFMRKLGKVMRNSSSNQKEWEVELQELRNYRATPHPSTGIPPNKLLFQTNSTTTKLPHHLTLIVNKEQNIKQLEQMTLRQKLKTRHHHFTVGHLVLVKWKITCKSDSIFDPAPFTIVSINGSMIILFNSSARLETSTKNKKTKVNHPNREDFSFSVSEDEENILNESENAEVQNTDNGFEARNEGDSSDANVDKRNSNLRRSQRETRPPDRYGYPVLSVQGRCNVLAYTAKALNGPGAILALLLKAYIINCFITGFKEYFTSITDMAINESRPPIGSSQNKIDGLFKNNIQYFLQLLNVKF
ncbi:Retrovirus-related Pol poly from transposon [Brachionus plicatilis]|uniref:Retrovirus-related Pol poly from transposon n=1 Tax=Brachionus plicatilis TaxID=10195 RepID=A0A3M7SRT3_BRAPC|nr:Retrovirus-related Pol poly from transposon [Brachionus plicatilis]